MKKGYAIQRRLIEGEFIGKWQIYGFYKTEIHRDHVLKELEKNKPKYPQLEYQKFDFNE